MPTNWGRKYVRTGCKVKISARGCFFRYLAAYHMKGFLKVIFQQKVMVTSTTLKIFFAVGWLWPPQMSGYMKGLFFGTVKYGNPHLGDSHKHHLNRLQKFFLNLGLQIDLWNSELVKGLSKKFLSQGWLLPLLIYGYMKGFFTGQRWWP